MSVGGPTQFEVDGGVVAFGKTIQYDVRPVFVWLHLLWVLKLAGDQNHDQEKNIYWRYCGTWGEIQNWWGPQLFGTDLYRFPIDPSQKMLPPSSHEAASGWEQHASEHARVRIPSVEKMARNLAWKIRDRMSCTVSLLQISLDICPTRISVRPFRTFPCDSW